MLLLIALPLVAIVYLALHQSFVQTELKEITTEVPLFGKQTREVTNMVVPQPVLDQDGKAMQGLDLCRCPEPEKRRSRSMGWQMYFAGEHSFSSLRRSDLTALPRDQQCRLLVGPGIHAPLHLRHHADYFDPWPGAGPRAVNRITPKAARHGGVRHAPADDRDAGGVLARGLLAVSRRRGDRGISWSPRALAVFYFLADQVTIRTVIISYGVWFATPFSFIILYAGLQTVPSSALEAAVIDGGHGLAAPPLCHHPPPLAASGGDHADPRNGQLPRVRTDPGLRRPCLRQFGAVSDLLHPGLRGQYSQSGGLFDPDRDRRRHPPDPGDSSALIASKGRAFEAGPPVTDSDTLAISGLGLWAWLFVALFPFLWMILISFQKTGGRFLHAAQAARTLHA